jgi:hypothetical protein
MSNQSSFVMSSPAVVPSSSAESPPVNKARRGFATMDPTKVRELGRKGGVSAHVAGRAHEFTSDEARAAGRKGGLAAREAKEGRRREVEVNQPS